MHMPLLPPGGPRQLLEAEEEELLAGKPAQRACRLNVRAWRTRCTRRALTLKLRGAGTPALPEAFEGLVLRSETVGAGRGATLAGADKVGRSQKPSLGVHLTRRSAPSTQSA